MRYLGLNSNLAWFGVVLAFCLLLAACEPADKSDPKYVIRGASQITIAPGNKFPKETLMPNEQIPPKKKSDSTTVSDARSTLVLRDSYADTHKLPKVGGAAEIYAHDMNQVRMVGIYVEYDARMKQDKPAQPSGHAAIRLSDNTLVTLFPTWHKDARRPVAEIQQFKDKQVEVVGIVFASAPPDPQGGASLQIPCITDIKGLWSK